MNIEIKDLRFTYPTGLEAIRGISFTIEAGEQVAIVGQNGAGKTTFVRHFNGLLTAYFRLGIDRRLGYKKDIGGKTCFTSWLCLSEP
jgi:energy-coupling factor transporter ATP-binding protein EcfA2